MALREQLGWSRAEFQRRLEDDGHNYHMTTIRRIEAGEQEPKLSEAVEIAGTLGVPVDLLTLDNEAAPALAKVSRELARFKDAISGAYKALDHYEDQSQMLAKAIAEAKHSGVPQRVLFDASDFYGRFETFEHLIEQWSANESRQITLDYMARNEGENGEG